MPYIFPQTPLPSIPFQVFSEFRTIVSQTDTGKEYRRRKWLYPKRRLRLQYGRRPQSEIESLFRFYHARRGKYEDFIFIFPYSVTWEDEFIGKGDGTTTAFKLPVWSWSSLTVYINGSPQTEGTDYTITTYTNDRPDITFSTAPADGDIITCDFTGQPALIMRFAQDVQDYQVFEALIHSLGLELQEVR